MHIYVAGVSTPRSFSIHWTIGNPGSTWGSQEVDGHTWGTHSSHTLGIAEHMSDLLAELRAAMPEDANGPDPVSTAVGHPIWTDPVHQRKVLEPFTDWLLATPVQAALLTNDGHRVRLKLALSGPLSALPWACLPVADKLLIELADIETTIPLTLLQHRTSHESPTGTPLYVIDPAPDRRAIHRYHGNERNPAFDRWVSVMSDPHVRGWGPSLDGDESDTTPAVTVSAMREGLSQPTSKLVYFGHCDAGPEHSPAAMSLGLAGEPLPAAAIAGLTADSAGWRMPPRVVLMACASGTDAQHHEPFGLVAAMVQAGAEDIVATRWPIPTDQYTGGGTTDLTLALDDAMDETNVCDAVNNVVRKGAQQWAECPGDQRYSPLLWSAVQVSCGVLAGGSGLVAGNVQRPAVPAVAR